ncbi:MAG: hypothetical protein ACLSB9_19595 [Hydrogeniiclostridium mannosilyticum]
MPGVFSRYQQSLLQRNSLLKDIPYHAELLDTLDVWDERLAGYGGRIIREGARMLSIRETAVAAYAGISAAGRNWPLVPVQRGRRHGGNEQQALLEALRAARREDVAAGHTSAGPIGMT